MVFKFCGGLWDATRPSDDDVEAATSRQRRLQELLQDTINRPVVKFQKELRVIFDSKRPHGIAFEYDDTTESLGYECRVGSIDAVPFGQAAEYNNRCKAIGDYGHVLVEGMHVRSVDHVDMQGVAFKDVLYRISHGCAGTTGCAVSFADVTSKPLGSTPRLRTVGNIVLAAQRVKGSPNKQTLLPAPASPTSRRSVVNANASPKISKWSSVLTAVVTENANANQTASQSDVLASDLAHKNTHLEAQVLILKGKLATLEREKTNLEKLRDDTAHASVEKLQTLETQQRALESELEHVRDQCTKFTQQNTGLSTANATMRSEISTLQSTVEKLQHEYDGVLLQLHELQVEHRDVQHHAEELHNRLVAAQLLKSELNEQITTIKREQSKDQAAVLAIQAMMPQSKELSPTSPVRRRQSSVEAMGDDSPTISLLKQILQSRDTLEAQNEELKIELSCHEVTMQHQQDKLIELEDQLSAMTQINDSLRSQVRDLMVTKASTDEPTTTITTSSSANAEIQELMHQLQAERSTNARIQLALQALEGKARAKLDQYEKEQLYLAQFKEQLVKGITVTKYGTRGQPHARILYSDVQCRWISWRSPSDGSTSPRPDAKAETLDLVEILAGATTATFDQATTRPEIPGRCLSLVFCRPCRTLDIEVETRDRAASLCRGFRLLAERAAETRRQNDDTEITAKH